MTEPDELLLDNLGRGDVAAFEGLFLRYYGQVYRVLYGLVRRRDLAEDLAQETFLELYRHVPRLQPGSTFLAWLCRVALNRGYNALRGERRAQHRLERLYAPEAADPDAELLRAEEHTRVQEALTRLTERQSKLLLLRNAGFSYAEIAAVVEVAPTSVGALLARAERAFLEAYNHTEEAERVDVNPLERTVQ